MRAELTQRSREESNRGVRRGREDRKGVKQQRAVKWTERERKKEEEDTGTIQCGQRV